MNTDRDRYRTRLGLLGLTLVCVAAGCGPSPRAHTGPNPTGSPPRPKLTVLQTIELPGNSWPSAMAPSPDGSVWVTEESISAIAEVDPARHVRQIRIPGESNDPGAIVRGSDGVIWFTGLEIIGYLDTNLQLREWTGDSPSKIGLPDALAAGSDGAIWYTNEATPYGITRLTPPGTFTSYAIPGTDLAEKLFGITAGPDKAIWFTMFTSGRVGRMTTGGAVREWPLPKDAEPRIITAGTDALWFTEAKGIGRVTANDGPVEYPLGTTAWDVTTAPDHSVWFVTDSTLGTVDDNGRFQQWPVSRENSLGALAAMPDGTFWLADNKNARLLHVALRP